MTVTRVRWAASHDAAQALARQQRVPVFLCICEPDREDCRRMERETFRDDGVKAFLAERVVPHAARADVERELAASLGVVWTPWLAWLSSEGEPCHASVGFLGPEDLLAESVHGCGRVAAREGRWEEARDRFETVAKRWPRAFVAPASTFWAGIAAERATGEAEARLAAWERLRSEYPESAWAARLPLRAGG